MCVCVCDRLPNITVPNLQLIPTLVQDGFVIGIVTFSVSVSLAKVFARQFGYKVDSSQVKGGLNNWSSKSDETVSS